MTQTQFTNGLTSLTLPNGKIAQITSISMTLTAEKRLIFYSKLEEWSKSYQALQNDIAKFLDATEKKIRVSEKEIRTTQEDSEKNKDMQEAEKNLSL